MSVMAIKLFAHILSASIPGHGQLAAATTKGSLDLGRWAFRDLVVRRADLAAWGLARPQPAGHRRSARRDTGAEPLWADTQPWCHE
jgi:hypothetical protein